MVRFNSREEMVVWVINNYFYGYTWKLIELIKLSDKRLSREISRITKGEMKMGKENNKYFLEYLY